MTRRNYKVYADDGHSTENLVRQLTVLDTGIGPNFVRKELVPSSILDQMKMGPMPSIADDNGKPVLSMGTVPLVVPLGDLVVKVEFVVRERLVASVILGCDSAIVELKVSSLR